MKSSDSSMISNRKMASANTWNNKIREKMNKGQYIEGMRQRQVWIDWMKVLGMLTIVWGHCFPKGMDTFLYAFNVPLFFLISGYLTRRESSMHICFNKCLHNLIIPYFILAFIKAAGPFFKHLSDGQSIWTFLGILGGFHSINGIVGCNNLWFVYSLILIKLLYQSWATNHLRKIIMLLVAVCGTLIYNYLELNWMWAVTNIFLALPFFIIGNWFSSEGKNRFNSLLDRLRTIKWYFLLLAVVLLAVITWIIGYFNDCAYLFEGQYGRFFPLFIVGATTGSLMVFFLSVILDNFNGKALRVISSGTIVILVFHRELLHSLIKWISQQEFSILAENIMIFLAACVVMLVFIPIILIVKRLFPIVLGKRSKMI